MSSSQSTINQRSFPNQQQPGQSKITVEYHRPSRESIQEYHALLADANHHAAEAAKYQPYNPSRPAPPPPPSASSLTSHKHSSETSLAHTSQSPPRVRNSLQKPPPKARRQSLTSASPTARVTEHDPFAHNSSSTIPHSNDPRSNGMSGATSPPPRPSRANTATLNDMFTTQNALAAHHISSPPNIQDEPQHYGEYDNQIPPTPSMEYSSATFSPTSQSSQAQTRSRSGTTSKSKKGVLGLMSMFSQSKRIEISTPYDPVHLTHVGFNSSTGEFTGLPKEWQQLLQESGISRSEQEKNPQAVMEIVKFYQEGQADKWDKIGNMSPAAPEHPYHPKLDDPLHNPVRALLCYYPSGPQNPC
jgi:p21-activated kinase 1